MDRPDERPVATQALTKIGSRTWLGDSWLLDIPRTTGFFYLDARLPVLIETSAAAVSDRVISALRDAGVDTLAYIIVTHVHLDHAGAAGQIAEAYPDAIVAVHEEGARHLLDPSRLEASAARVFGEERMLRHWGRLKPVPNDRLLMLRDGDTLDLGDRSLDVIYAPGHARHQIAIADSETGGIFLGDSAGIYLSDFAYQTPSAPPPDLNPDLAIESLARISERDPEVVFFTHFGPGHDPDRLLTTASEQYRRWGEVALGALRRNSDLETVAARLRDDADPERKDLPPELREQLDLFVPHESAAAGYKRHFEQLGITPAADV